MKPASITLPCLLVAGMLSASVSYATPGLVASQVAPGQYVCYDLVLHSTGMAFGLTYGYEYRDTFTILPGSRYRRKSGGEGRFRYDAAVKTITFLNGPYAATRRSAQYVPSGKSLKARLARNAGGRENTSGGSTPNIILHKNGDKSGDADWYCMLMR